MSSQTIMLCLISAALLGAGCGKKEADTSASSSPSAPSAAPAPPAANATPSAAAPAAETTAPAGPHVLELTANDTMKFNVTRLEAKAGETVRVVLRNVGNLPKAAMGHNFVLLKAGVKPEEIAAAAALAGPAKDYYPADQADKIIAHSKLIGPREKAEVTFAAPTEPGEYVYLCTFPGHLAAGMHGVLVITN